MLPNVDEHNYDDDAPLCCLWKYFALIKDQLQWPEHKMRAIIFQFFISQQKKRKKYIGEKKDSHFQAYQLASKVMVSL